MSRPDSPIKSSLNDDETMKKMKAMLIKEKRLNKENLKLLSDLNKEIERKTEENATLTKAVNQLTLNNGVDNDRNVSALNEKNYEICKLNEKVSELECLLNQRSSKLQSIANDAKDFCVSFGLDTNDEGHLKVVKDEFSRLREENFRLSNEIEVLNIKNKKFEVESKNDLQLELETLKHSICLTFTELIHKCMKLNQKEYHLDSSSDIGIIFKSIFSFCNDMYNNLSTQKDSNDVLQDGFDRITAKCFNLEGIIEAYKEKNIHLENCLKDTKQFLIEKDEQIRRLEQMVEDSRNISRALEKERDQLQSDLMDLRQRHEEKEAYLVEECREAKRGMENYRKIRDKEIEEKLMEIENLQCVLMNYERNSVSSKQYDDNHQNFVNKDYYSQLDRILREKFQIPNDDRFNHHVDLVLFAIEKYDKTVHIMDTKLAELQTNESDSLNKIEQISKTVQNLEAYFDKAKGFEILQREIVELKERSLEKDVVMECINQKLFDKEETIFRLDKQSKELKMSISSIFKLMGIISSNELDVDRLEELMAKFHQFMYSHYELERNYAEIHEKLTMEKAVLISDKERLISELSNRLKSAEKQLSSSDLMNLEMAEIDRTLINLNNQLTNKCSEVSDLEAALKSKKDEILLLGEQIIKTENENRYLEERNNKMKQLLVKTKKESTDYKIELDKLQNQLVVIHTQLESYTTLLEESKIQLSEALREKELLNEHCGLISKKYETLMKNKDTRIVALKSELDLSVDNMKILQQEFEAYKIKAQATFNAQFRSKSNFSNFMVIDKEVPVSNSENIGRITDLEALVANQKLDLQEAEDKLFLLNNEIEMLTTENEKWTDKYKSLMKENVDVNVKMQQIVQQYQEENKLQQMSYADLSEKFAREKDKIIDSYQSQLDVTIANYKMTIENLDQQLKIAEFDKVRCEEELWECREQLRNFENKLNSQNLENNASSKPAWPWDQERQQGEGMEANDNHDFESASNFMSSPKVSSAPVYVNNLVPLERLISISSGVEITANEQLTTLAASVNTYKRKVEHLSELLNDSEAAVSRFTDQAEILKAEIRRLENNREREQNLHDQPSYEYLKNVIMKFLHFDTTSDERSQLIPVLVTLLSLNANEKDMLVKFSKMTTIDKRQGWSSYFGWSGTQ